MDMEANKILSELSEAGIEDASSLSQSEQQQIYRTLKESRQDCIASSSLSISQGDSGKTSKEGKDTACQTLQSEKVFESKSFDYNSHKVANTNQSFGEKDVTKQSHHSNYASALGGSPSASSRPPRPSPGSAVQVKTTVSDINSRYQANTSSSNDGVWSESGKKNKENGTVMKKSAASVKEETTSEVTVTATADDSGNSVGKDNNNTACESKDRESPDTLETVPLMPLVFMNRNTTSFLSDKALPPFSLPKEEWLNKVSEYLFARKVARIEAIARRARWVILSERSISILSLENAVAKSSPQHTKDDSAYNFSESNENSPKARISPENTVDNVPDVVTMENSPKGDPVNSESRDEAAIVLPDSSKKHGKIETPHNSPAGRSVDDYAIGDGETRRRTTRNRNRKSKGGNKPNSSNEDNSDGTPSSSVLGKNNERDYTPNSAEFPRIGGNSPSANDDEQVMTCPICKQCFKKSVIEGHAWGCGRSSAEEEIQVAEKNGGRSDETEFKQRKLFPLEDEDEDLPVVKKPISILSKVRDKDDDFVGKPLSEIPRKFDNDDDFVTITAPSISRKRNLITSDDEDTPSKSSRK